MEKWSFAKAGMRVYATVRPYALYIIITVSIVISFFLILLFKKRGTADTKSNNKSDDGGYSVVEDEEIIPDNKIINDGMITNDNLPLPVSVDDSDIHGVVKVDVEFNEIKNNDTQSVDVKKLLERLKNENGK